MSFSNDERWIDWVDALSADDFVVIDDFFPPGLYQQIRQFLILKLKEDEFHQAGIGSLNNKQQVSSIRGDFTYWLDQKRDEELHGLFEVINETIRVYNRLCYLSLSGFEFHLAYYPAGTYYKRHLDQFQDRSNRMISMIIYFNEGWEKGDGGELKIFKEHEEVLVEPIANRCVMFKSADVPHEVTKTNVGRYSLTGWLLYQPSGVGYLLG